LEQVSWATPYDEVTPDLPCYNQENLFISQILKLLFYFWALHKGTNAASVQVLTNQVKEYAVSDLCCIMQISVKASLHKTGTAL